jgi:hypothetical protein
MPRTEGDLDWLMTEIEIHKQVSAMIGEKVKSGELTHEEAIDTAAIADAKLYDVCDQIAIEREEEFVAGDEQLSEAQQSGSSTS